MIRQPKRLRATARPYRIAIEQRGTGKDGFGQPSSEIWSEVGRAWAAVNFGSGSEQREAAQVGGAQTATFDIRREALPAGSVRFRIRYPLNEADPTKSPIWDIHAIGDIEPDGLALTATRVAA